MFDQFKAMGAIASLLKNQDRLREAHDRVREQMETARVEADAGGGAVRVVVTGTMRVESVVVEPALAAGMACDEQTRDLAGSLVVEAINDALQRAQALLQEAISREVEALGLPELPGDLQRLLSP